MKKLLCLLFCSLLLQYSYGQLKAIVYDFDGLTLGDKDLPDEDLGYDDMDYKVATNPLGESDMLGDRVLQLNLNWSKGTGTWGCDLNKFIQLNPSADKFNFFFFNPASNGQNAQVEVMISEDDDQDNFYDVNKDDQWKKTLSITPNPGWQLISIPLSEFTDANPGGNGIFDATFTDNKGSVTRIEFTFSKPETSPGNASYYIDMICFSEGSLRTGTSALDLPSANTSDHCVLGAFTTTPQGEEYTIPSIIEGFFPKEQGKKLKYINWFLAFGTDGSAEAKELPGEEVSKLLKNGYVPIITWEPLFKGYDRLDPVQPRLNNLINGEYDSYIDAFGDQLKSYNDTVIVRLMHEFEGDWYPWSIVYNGEDPNKYITAYRKIVDRIRARGANKVKWMWCTNGDYFPRRFFNWIVTAYPGDNYVDIVASDIYNNHTPLPTPSWKSFRSKAAETYYYLTKYFPNKPMFICELGCRERFDYENSGSQTKSQWLTVMDKEMQTNFSKVRALLFFSEKVIWDWRVNSSTEVTNTIANTIWNDDYYFKGLGQGISSVSEIEDNNSFTLNSYPSPSRGNLVVKLKIEKPHSELSLEILNVMGQKVYGTNRILNQEEFSETIDTRFLSPGTYFVKVIVNKETEIRKVVID